MLALDRVQHDRLAVGHGERRHVPAHARAALVLVLERREALARDLRRIGRERQHVAALQHPPVEAAEAAGQISAAAAEHLFHRDTTGEREVAARTARGAADRHTRAAGHEHRPVDRHVGFEFRTDERDQGVALEQQIGAEHRELERRRAVFVADERIRQRQRERVHRAAGAQTHVLVAVTPHVLDRHQEPRPEDLNAHLPLFWNSAREIGLKRTRSPAANRLGSWRSASNTASGVRPMMLQPPEMAYG